MRSIVEFLLIAVAVALTNSVVSGIHFADGWTTIFWVSLVWALLVFFVRPVLNFITFPITILTLGLFHIVINVFLFFLVTHLVPGVSVDSTASLIIGALVLSLFTWGIQRAI